MELENAFSVDFRKNGRGHRKYSMCSVLFEVWKYSLSSTKNMPQKAGFSAFLKHGASLYLKFEGLNLSVVIIFKTFHWLKNFESCSVISVARCQCYFASEK